MPAAWKRDRLDAGNLAAVARGVAGTWQDTVVLRGGEQHRAGDPVEVAEIFEVPRDFILDARNHQRRSREVRGFVFDVDSGRLDEVAD